MNKSKQNKGIIIINLKEEVRKKKPEISGEKL